MTDSNGTLSVDQTFELLSDVSQDTTRWSVVYDLIEKRAHVAMSRRFEKRYQFSPATDDGVPAESETTNRRGKED